LACPQLQQRYALACIYYATFAVRTQFTDAILGGPVQPPGWFRSDNWVTDADECTWFGITCAAGNVAAIELFSNRLTGTFPAETIIMANSLIRMDLFNNVVWNPGDANNAWLGQLSNIEFLFYGSTNFDYPGIPTEIGLLTKLKEYDCSFTLYFGPLRAASFQNLMALQYVVLSGNAYNQTVPTALTSLPDLQFMYIEDSFISGDLSFMQPMTVINEMWADLNPGLGGAIPAFLGTKTTLTSFSISECSFTGPIPPELGQLTQMESLWLFGNQLSGAIPSELGNLGMLQLLQLQENNLAGTMPAEICANRGSFGQLTTLVADCNGAITCPTGCCTFCFPIP
jgi:hypothetical protein